MAARVVPSAPRAGARGVDAHLSFRLFLLLKQSRQGLSEVVCIVAGVQAADAESVAGLPQQAGCGWAATGRGGARVAGQER
jgi:hypothetical protein